MIIAIAALFLASCKKGGANAKPEDVAYYTCTMHPSVKSQDPKAKCPICNMDLVPVKKSAAGAADYYTCSMHPSVKSKDPKAKCPLCNMDLTPVKSKTGDTNAMATHVHASTNTTDTNAATMPQTTEFTVPTDRQQMIGVTYATIEKKPIQQTLRAVGFVTYDKQRHWDFVSRVEGYVQKLEVSSRGQLVEQNQPLLTIYSPDLLTTQNEFVDVLKMRDEARAKGQPTVIESSEKLVGSAKQRLRLWNISDAQLAELEKTRKPQETLTLYSPFKGVIQNLQVDQGRRVMPGDHLVDVADLSVLWVWAEFYQDELPLLKKDLPITITTSAYAGEKFTGNIALIDPFLNETKRTGRVRVDVPNPEMKLRPEMYVDTQVTIDMGESLVVPVSAVLPTGKRFLVFVDKGEGKLEPRFIEVGRKFEDVYAVTSGLKEGERVVASGNFLIDAESKVQGAVKTF